MRTVLGWVIRSLVVGGLLAWVPMFASDSGVDLAWGQAPQTTTYLIGQYRSSVDPSQRSLTVITIRNNRDLLTDGVFPNVPGPCEVGILWRNIDGTNECTITPIVISAGEVKQFCSRRLPPQSGIARCQEGVNRNAAVCTDGVPSGSAELVESQGVAFVRVVDRNRVCPKALSVDPQIVYTTGSMDDSVSAVFRPGVIRVKGTSEPTGTASE